MRISEQRYINRRWQLVICLLLWGCMASSALAYEHAFCQSPMSKYQSPITNVQSSATLPSYQFRSTSTLAPVVGTTHTYAPLADSPYGAGVGGPRRGPWDDPGDNPIGEVDDPAPIGEPLVLILFALLFLCFKLTGKSVK